MKHKGHKYRIYPTDEQKQYLDRNFGAVRFLWNKFVEMFLNHKPGDPWPKFSEKLIKDMEEHSWLHECIAYALQQKRMDWAVYLKQFFNKDRKKKVGLPKFKKRDVSNDSFRIPAASMPKGLLENLELGLLKAPKMKDPIIIVVDRMPEGRPLSVTFSKDRAGRYFVSILTEFEPKTLPLTGRSVGIDLGLMELMTSSNGIVVSNPRWFRETQAKLARAQRHLSRKKKGSKRYERQRIKVARLHRKISDQRAYVLHCLSKWLVTEFDHIIMEGLRPANMVKNRRLAKSISDASFGMFLTMVSYKADWYGKTFHQVDPFFASSKTCSSCGIKLKELGLEVREWTCDNCSAVHDRDLNAAYNILNKGFEDLYGISAESADYRRGEFVRPSGVEEIPLPKANSVKRLFNFIDLDRVV